MAAPAKALPALDSTIQHFNLPDFSRHALWLVPRLVQGHPWLNEQGVLGFLRGIIDSNEYLFLCQEHSVALAQVMSQHTMAPKPVIWERFVLAQSPQYVAEAERFYPEFQRWARNMGVDTITVGEMTDVPMTRLTELFGGQLFTKKLSYARV